jgi:hypothetical protein
MNTIYDSHQKTFFVFVAYIEDKELIALLEELLSNCDTNYVNVLYITDTKDRISSTRMKEIQALFYNRLLIKHLPMKPKKHIDNLFGVKNRMALRHILQFKTAITQFVKEYKTYAKNIEYYIVGNHKTNRFIETTLINTSVDKSKIYVVNEQS